MLFRGSNAVGYSNYPDNVVAGFVKHSADAGMDIFRIFDSLNYLPNNLVDALKQEISIPIHFHTHDTSGLNAASVIAATRAGVDIVDLAIASMSGSTSQPNLNSVCAALANSDRDPGLSMDTLNLVSDYWEEVLAQYKPFDSAPRAGTAEVYEHEMPGGQYTNLREQANAMGLGHRWREIARTYADVNQLFGDIVKVTPTSKAEEPTPSAQ